MTAQDEVNKIIREHLYKQQVLIILDGLDEITDIQLRDDVINSIQSFVAEYYTFINDIRRFVNDKRSVTEGGNQLVVTSRIVGYHSRPLLKGLLTHVTVEPMDNNAISHFCEAWIDALLKKPESLPEIGTETSGITYSAEDNSFISTLPNELWMHILSFLDEKTMSSAKIVCKSWNCIR